MLVTRLSYLSNAKLQGVPSLLGTTHTLLIEIFATPTQIVSTPALVLIAIVCLVVSLCLNYSVNSVVNYVCT